MARTARLEIHLGFTVAAAAAALGAAMAEQTRDGAVSASMKAVGGETVAGLLKLYFLVAPDFVDFNRVARERGVEILVENDVPLGDAEFLVDETMRLLSKVMAEQLN
jgi:hypothetical protein